MIVHVLDISEIPLPESLGMDVQGRKDIRSSTDCVPYKT